MNSIEQKCSHLNSVIKQRHKNKINLLINKPLNNKQIKINDNWICNLTNLQIPTVVKYVLSLGPKFSFPNVKLSVTDTLANIENGIAHLNENSKTNIRNKICNIMTNYLHKFKHNNRGMKNQLNYFIKQTKEFIKNNQNIYILSADKCNKTVVMFKDDYINKMYSLLNDTTTYKKEVSNITNKIQNNMNSLIITWFKNSFIDVNLKNKLTCYNGYAPYIYGLPKLHKENYPLRPIVSNTGSPTYQLSKYLAQSLSNIIGKSQYHVQNSWEFCNFIKRISIPKNHILVSFDVVSLYTNIPVDLAIHSINKNWGKIKDFTNLPKEEFVKAVEFCLTSTFFCFNDEFYSQVFGIAMGSPISACIANLVMEEVENEILSSLDFTPTFYKRYVDDCLLCIPADKIEYTLQKFNSYHSKIKFTIEKEINKSINFLDVTISYNENGTISTNWFTKKVWSGRYLNFESSVPSRYKKSVVNSLTDRAVLLSDPKYRPFNIRKIKKTLENNNYPKKFFDPIIKSRINRYYNSTSKNCTNKQDKKYVSLTYNPYINKQIANILKPFNIEIADKPQNHSKQFFTKLKPDIPKSETANTVYKINCKDCSSIYIGQSSQYLKNRIRNHKNDIRNLKDSTALSRHALENDHNIDFENTTILDIESNFSKRCFKEMVYIKKHQNTLNYRTDISNLSNIYNNII